MIFSSETASCSADHSLQNPFVDGLSYHPHQGRKSHGKEVPVCPTTVSKEILDEIAHGLKMFISCLNFLTGKENGCRLVSKYQFITYILICRYQTGSGSYVCTAHVLHLVVISGKPLAPEAILLKEPFVKQISPHPRGFGV
jgi:hypothetical protein